MEKEKDIELTQEEKDLLEQTQIKSIELANQEKYNKVFEVVNNTDDLDILKHLSIWGLKQKNNPNLNREEVLDVLNKISECNVAIYNSLNNTDVVVDNALFSWILKEPTPIEFKAKFR